MSSSSLWRCYSNFTSLRISLRLWNIYPSSLSWPSLITLFLIIARILCLSGGLFGLLATAGGGEWLPRCPPPTPVLFFKKLAALAADPQFPLSLSSLIFLWFSWIWSTGVVSTAPSDNSLALCALESYLRIENFLDLGLGKYPPSFERLSAAWDWVCFWIAPLLIAPVLSLISYSGGMFANSNHELIMTLSSLLFLKLSVDHLESLPLLSRFDSCLLDFDDSILDSSLDCSNHFSMVVANHNVSHISELFRHQSQQNADLYFTLLSHPHSYLVDLRSNWVEYLCQFSKDILKISDKILDSTSAEEYSQSRNEIGTLEGCFLPLRYYLQQRVSQIWERETWEYRVAKSQRDGQRIKECSERRRPRPSCHCLLLCERRVARRRWAEWSGDHLWSQHSADRLQSDWQHSLDESIRHFPFLSDTYSEVEMYCIDYSGYALDERRRLVKGIEQLGFKWLRNVPKQQY